MKRALEKCTMADAIKALIALGLLAGFAISWPLWTNTRLFPLVPILGPFPAPVDKMLLAGVGFCLFGMFWPRAGRLPIGGFLILALLMVLQDRMRWQPWLYQYSLMLVPYLVFRDMGQILRIHRLIIAAVYTWSGIHKFGAGFSHMWEGFIVRDHTWLHPFAPAVGPIEVAIGLSLLFVKSQRIGAGCAIGMHVGLLWILGPFGHDINPVVWPWNIVMMILCAALFFPGGTKRSVFNQRLPLPAWPLLLLAWVMPALSHIGAWPNYLSWHLYAARNQRLLLFVKPHAIDRIDPPFREQVKPSKAAPGLHELNMAGWSEHYLRVPMVSEDPVWFHLMQEALKSPLQKGDAFVYRDYPNWLNEWGYISYPAVDFRTFEAMPKFEKTPRAEIAK